MKEALFTFDNFKFAVKELIKMYSGKPSYFSRKRVNEGVAFYAAIFADLSYCFIHRLTLNSMEMLAHTTLLLAAAGYHLNEIQKEKKDASNSSDSITSTESTQPTQ